MINVINTNKQRIITRKETVLLINCVLKNEGINETDINVIFVDSNTIMELNSKYLGHNWVTDVLSFPLSEVSPLEGEIYVCTNKAIQQARQYDVSDKEEVKRLIIHGVLHLLGYTDKTKQKRNIMKSLEEKYLKISLDVCKKKL